MVQAAYLHHALSSLPWSPQFWHLPIFWPTPWTQLMLDPMVAQAFLLRLVWWGAGSQVALDANLLFVLTLASGFWGMALLARRCGLRGGAAILAGVVYVLGPFAVGHWQHLNQLPSAWIPVALWAWLSLVDSGRSGRERIGASAVLVLCVSLQLSSSVYMSATLGVGLVLTAAIHPPRDRMSRILASAAAILASAAVVSWAQLFLRARNEVEGYGRSVSETGPLQARLFDLLNAPQSHLLGWPGHDLARPALYPGLLWLGVAGFGLWQLWPQSRRRFAWILTLGGAGMVLAVGRTHP